MEPAAQPVGNGACLEVEDGYFWLFDGFFSYLLQSLESRFLLDLPPEWTYENVNT